MNTVILYSAPPSGELQYVPSHALCMELISYAQNTEDKMNHLVSLSFLPKPFLLLHTCTYEPGSYFIPMNKVRLSLQNPIVYTLYANGSLLPLVTQDTLLHALCQKYQRL